MATHRVTKGNSLKGLARLYYQDDKAEEPLALANQLRKGASLPPGSTLRLPARLFYFDSLVDRQAMSTTALLGVFPLRSDLVFVEVREEWLGRGANVVGAIEGKWLYVVGDGSIVVSAEVPVHGEWTIENDLFSEQKFALDETLVLLSGRDYRFLLSPYKLTSKAESRFVERAGQFWNSERQAGKPDAARHIEWTILVRDAYQWALDVHRLLYLPRLDAYRKWIADHADALFIASTLKCLVDAQDASWFGSGTDPLRLVDDLNPGEPNHYLTQVYQKGLDEPRLEAETAAAKLATILYSEEHQTIELSAMEDGESALEATTLMWEDVLAFVNETLPGRKLLQMLARDAERFPVKYLLTNAPPANGLQFSQLRYLANAAIAIIKDLAPAWLALNQTEAARSRLQQLAQFISAAAGAGVSVIEKSFRAMHQNLMQGVPLGQGVKYRETTRLLLEAQAGFDEALQAAHCVEPPSASLVRNVKLADTLAKSSALMGVRGVLEVINFANAFNDYTVDPSHRKKMGLAGAIADLTALVVDVGTTLLKQLDKAAIKGAGAGLGIISGICDSIEFGISASEAADRDDYDAAVGMSIAFAGANLITVGSSLGLYSTVVAGLATVESSAAAGAFLGVDTLAALRLGRLGARAGILGLALVAAGTVWWRVANDSDYEQFASRCFLGRSYGRELKPSWTSVAFPVPTTAAESKALVHLLSSFRVSLDSRPGQRIGPTPYRLTLLPSFYGENDVFEVYLEHHLDSPATKRLAARVTVHVSSGEVRQQSGERLAPIIEVVRGDNGRVEAIRLSETYADPIYGSAAIYTARIVRVRLQIEPGDVIPKAGNWVGVHVTGMEEFDRPKATSSDFESWVDSNKAPFLATQPL